MSIINIAIDCPAGAGKSSIARRVAAGLALIYVDTGALYRTIGYYMTSQGIELTDTDRIIAALDGLEVSLDYVDGEQHVFANGQDVSSLIRTPAMSMAASKVSAIPAVRAFLLDVQRHMAATRSVIMDGRDIGTTILPHADVKIFLTASPEARATRRFKELQEKGDPATYDEVLADMIKRDYEDTHRETSPLRQAEDAVLVDTSELDFEQSVAAVKKVITDRVSL